MKQIKRLAFVLVVALSLVGVAPSWVPVFGVETVQAAVKLNKTKATVYEGAALNLKITGTSGKVTWSSSKKAVAKVDSKGKVTALKPGKAVITAKVGNKSYVCKVTVPAPDINQYEAELEVGEYTALKIEKSKMPVKWKSSDAKVASVDKNGVVTAKKNGKATVTGTANGRSYRCNIFVGYTYDDDDDYNDKNNDNDDYNYGNDNDERNYVVYVDSISLNKTSVELTVGDTCTLTASVYPYNATDKTVTWSSNNTSVASVNSYGVVTAADAGTAVITAYAGGKTSKCQVTVSKKAESVNDRREGFIKVIKDKGNYDGDKYTLKKSYKEFVYTISYHDDVDMVSLSLLDSESKVVLTLVDFGTIVIDSFGDVIYEAEAYIFPKTFTKNSSAYFKVTSGRYSSNDIQDVSNAFLKIGFTLWEDMMEQYGYTLADLGFLGFN